MELILIGILIWVIVSLFKGDKGKIPSGLEGPVHRLEKAMKKAKKLEKEARKKGRPDIAAQAHENYKVMEQMVYGIRHARPSAEYQRMNDLERRVREAERRAEEAEWAAWRNRW